VKGSIDDEVGCTTQMNFCDLTVTDINENGEIVGTTEILPSGPERAIVLLRSGMVIDLGSISSMTLASSLAKRLHVAVYPAIRAKAQSPCRLGSNRAIASDAESARTALLM
jgi:hypothetical protein